MGGGDRGGSNNRKLFDMNQKDSDRRQIRDSLTKQVQMAGEHPVRPRFMPRFPVVVSPFPVRNRPLPLLPGPARTATTPARPSRR
jgi:hypothetical protein